MNTKFLFFAFFIVSLVVFGQSTNNVEDQQFKINFLTPGVEYELGTGLNTTLNIRLGTSFGLVGGSHRSTEFGIFPLVEGQYRYYTNMKRRIDKGKSIAANTGNYVALSALYLNGNPIFGDLELDSGDNLFIGPLYGLQRTSKSGFNFGLEFGAGYYQNDINSGITGRINFSIGWVLGKNRKK